jgi:hypothetical protein
MIWGITPKSRKKILLASNNMTLPPKNKFVLQLLEERPALTLKEAIEYLMHPDTAKLHSSTAFTLAQAKSYYNWACTQKGIAPKKELKKQAIANVREKSESAPRVSVTVPTVDKKTTVELPKKVELTPEEKAARLLRLKEIGNAHLKAIGGNAWNRSQTEVESTLDQNPDEDPPFISKADISAIV